MGPVSVQALPSVLVNTSPEYAMAIRVSPLAISFMVASGVPLACFNDCDVQVMPSVLRQTWLSWPVAR